jgi:type II secretory pathway component GspD/PulD (secretin)
LNVELSEGKSHVLADTTLNGISGQVIKFENTSTTRYRDAIKDSNGDLYSTVVRDISTGLVLNINGWVSGEDMITVTVDAQVSKQVAADNSSNDTTALPSTSEKKVSTSVRTKSGEPVIIGGLFQTEVDISEKKVPFLGSIPIIGRLFTDSVESSSDTEFVIYLVPFVQKNETEVLSEEENLARLKEKYEIN